MTKEIPYVETAAWLGAAKLCNRRFAIRATPDVWKNLGFNSTFWFQNSVDNTYLWLSPTEQENWLSHKFGAKSGSDLIGAEVGILHHPDEMDTISSHETECVVADGSLGVPIPKGILLKDVRSKRNSLKKLKEYMLDEEVKEHMRKREESEEDSEDESYEETKTQTQTQKLMTPSEWWEAVQTVVIGIEQDVGNVDILLDVLVKMKIK